MLTKKYFWKYMIEISLSKNKSKRFSNLADFPNFILQPKKPENEKITNKCHNLSLIKKSTFWI